MAKRCGAGGQQGIKWDADKLNETHAPHIPPSSKPKLDFLYSQKINENTPDRKRSLGLIRNIQQPLEIRSCRESSAGTRTEYLYDLIGFTGHMLLNGPASFQSLGRGDRGRIG